MENNKTEKGNIRQLIPDDKNFNKHSEYGMSLLEKSVGKFGMGRSILVDKNNRIIAGNGITETAGAAGIEDVRFIDTDGTEIIAVRRNDIDLDTPEGREMALADNATNKANLHFDTEIMDIVLPELDINPADWGIKGVEDMGLSTEGIDGGEEYGEFVDKFKPKLTTDDCYTPPEVYKAVKDWVDKNITPLAGREIIRPFKPGGDYQAEEYPAGCIVLDNPPFSISAQILDFYMEHKILFFLFGNALTLLSAKREGLTYIVTGETIEFENGAKVHIGYFTNLCPEIRVWLAADLAAAIRDAQATPPDLPKNKWDIHLQSAALLAKIASRVNAKIPAKSSTFISTLSDGTQVFGGGIILSDTAARKLYAAQRQAEDERRKAEAERQKAEDERAVIINLGPKEQALVEMLNRTEQN